MSAGQENADNGGVGQSQPDAEVETPLRRFIADYMENKIAILGAIGVFVVVLIALFGPLIRCPDGQKVSGAWGSVLI